MTSSLPSPGSSHPGCHGSLSQVSTSPVDWLILAPQSRNPHSQSGRQLASSDESQLCWRPSHGGTTPVDWLRGVFPCFDHLPSFSFMKQHSFGFSASISLRVFAMRSPFRVESVSVLDRNEGSSYTFLVFGQEPSR